MAESLTIKLDSGIRALLTEYAAKQGAGEKIEETARRLLSQAVWEATNPRDDWEFQTAEADDNARTVTFERHTEQRCEGAASAAKRLCRAKAREWFRRGSSEPKDDRQTTLWGEAS